MVVESALPDHLADTLDQLGYSHGEGLVSLASTTEYGPIDYAWQDLRDKVGLDAVFFRDGIPLVGFTGKLNRSGLAGIRRRLWNYGRVPILLASSPDMIVAYNATGFSNAGEDGATVLASDRRTSTTRQVLEAFHRSQVLAGRFATEFSRSYTDSVTVDSALLANLHTLRDSYSRPATIERAAIDALIGGGLLASYLADRNILTRTHIEEMTEETSLDSVLTAGRQATIQLFEGLAEHFNGDVFGPLPDHLRSLDEDVIQEMAALLRGDDLATGNGSLWPYDFSVLPADLVSNVYERLLEETQRADAAYYTPRFLVHLILDEVLPWDEIREPTILDPACGSGAFITEAFRRLCYRARVRLGRDLTYAELKSLLLGNVFGIDRNPIAARTTVFGLYLALLEELDPPTVWDTAVLPTLLDRTVLVSDSFDETNRLFDRKFDVIVGNPPWSSRLTRAAAKYVRINKLPVADNQIAQAFLWLVRDMLSSEGRLGLLMPAKPLLHNKSGPARSFRSEVFSVLNVRTIIDLSTIRRSVFHASVSPAAVIVAELPRYDTETLALSGEILYASAHPRPVSEVVDALVITPEEVRSVSQKQAATRLDIWKTLVWGGHRDLALIERLRTSFPSLSEIVEKHGWTSGRGYQVAGGDDIDASDLMNLPDVPTTAVNRLRIDSDALGVFDQRVLHRPRSILLYRGPHVLIRRTITRGHISAALVDQDAVFKDGVIGIAGSSEDRNLLGLIAGVISSSLGSYWHFLTGASWGIERDYVELNEHLSMPIPAVDAAQMSELIDLIDHSSERIDGEVLRDLDEIVFDIYGLTSSERARVIECVTVRINGFRNPKSYVGPVGDVAIDSYVDVLTSTLRDAVPTLGIEGFFQRYAYYCGVAITLRDPRVDQTGMQARPLIDVERIIEQTSYSQAKPLGIIAQPAGFYVDEDTIYIVKTADSDRWSQDAALDDADRIFSALAFGG